MLNDLLNSLQRDGVITEAVSRKEFRWDFIRSCGFRDIKGFEHGLDFANREREFRHIRRGWCIGSASR